MGTDERIRALARSLDVNDPLAVQRYVRELQRSLNVNDPAEVQRYVRELQRVAGPLERLEGIVARAQKTMRDDLFTVWSLAVLVKSVCLRVTQTFPREWRWVRGPIGGNGTGRGWTRWAGRKAMGHRALAWVDRELGIAAIEVRTGVEGERTRTVFPVTRHEEKGDQADAAVQAWRRWALEDDSQRVVMTLEWFDGPGRGRPMSLADDPLVKAERKGRRR